MSFILDALRKSDSERQQQVAPGLATTPQRKSKPRQKCWVPLLIIVLILNVAVIAAVTNAATGTSGSEITHGHVLKIAGRMSDALARMIEQLVKNN